ncbi:hypothetical protein EYB25_005084 [Talaromyces marneffei]|nr:hypothetical protein EYB25_005084 [Talaromyces marneffei]
MGNIGGPSKGCNRCKRLKVKCDEARPECLRCERAQQKCTGYIETETFDARVRYETGLGNRRVTRIRRSKEKALDVVAPAQKHVPPKKASTEKNASLLEVAVLLFKTAHVASYDSPNFSWNPSQDDCLERFISIMNESDDDSSLKQAISAVYNGFYSFMSKSKEMETASETSFAAAVSLARAALDDPVDSKSDATLLTVLLLSMFENFCSVKDYRSPAKTHWIGLAQLLQHRGPESLDSSVSLFCLHQFYFRLAAVTLGGETETMKELLDLSKSIPLPCNMQPTNNLASIAERLARLRLQLETINLCSRFDVQRTTLLMQLAQQIDGDLMRWPDYVPPSCHPKQKALDFYLNYPDWEDTYPSLAVAQDWNHYRYLRIMANIIISRCAAVLRLYSQAAAADQICEQMVDEVCASVIYYIGRLKLNYDDDDDEPDIQRKQAGCVDEKYAIATIGAMLLLPKLRWILQAEPSLRPKQRTCLQLHVKKILHFYRIHGVESVDILDEESFSLF